MKIKQIILTDRVKLNLLPTTYTFEIDGKTYDAEDDEPFDDDDYELMIEIACEEIAFRFVDDATWEEHEELLAAMDDLQGKVEEELVTHS